MTAFAMSNEKKHISGLMRVVMYLGFMLIVTVEQVKSQKSSLPPRNQSPIYNYAIAFPENSQNVKHKNKDGRLPLYFPARCPQNQLFYPGEQEADWICDCAPGFVYHPKYDKCFGVYREGPCGAGKYLILNENEVIPRCVPNPCNTDGMVLCDDACWKLNQPGGPCPRIEEGGGIFSINATTLLPDCVTVDILAQLQSDLPKFGPPGCYRGSKRSIRKRGCAKKR